MKKMVRVLASPLLVSLVWSSTAAAKEVRVPFSNCVMAGVEHGCLMIRSGGQLYNITAAHPRPQVNWGISGYGTRSAGVSTCMQGIILTNIHWQRIRLQCPIRPVRRRG
jgi:hypothetical protein